MLLRSQLGSSAKNLAQISTVRKEFMGSVTEKSKTYQRRQLSSNHSWSLKIALGPSDLQMTSLRSWEEFELTSK